MSWFSFLIFDKSLRDLNVKLVGLAKFMLGLCLVFKCGKLGSIRKAPLGRAFRGLDLTSGAS